MTETLQNNEYTLLNNSKIFQKLRRRSFFTVTVASKKNWHGYSWGKQNVNK